MKLKLVDFQFNLESISKLDVYGDQKWLKFYFFIFCILVNYGISRYIKTINHSDLFLQLTLHVCMSINLVI